MPTFLSVSARRDLSPKSPESVWIINLDLVEAIEFDDDCATIFYESSSPEIGLVVRHPESILKLLGLGK